MGGGNLLEAGANEQRLVEHGRHGLVHERVRLDEVERDVGQGLRVVDALARPRLRHLCAINVRPS